MGVEGSLASLEGRMLAHRKLLAQLLAASPASVRASIGIWLADRSTFHDGQEDPGAVPQAALALELALSDEFRKISELAETIMQPTGGSPDGTPPDDQG